MKDAKDIKSLLHQISKNDEHAFRDIFHLFSGRVYSFALKLTRSQATAEEMVQEVFMKLWVNRASLGTIDNFSGYLFIITKNLVLNILKRRALEEKVKGELSVMAETASHYTEQAVPDHDYDALLKETISHLPPQQRIVYSLCHQEGLRYDEVAERLNISRLTVKTHMHKALKTIKAHFAGLPRH
ncbi:MAG TPA: RNA polymerase sigma-70 factor [Chryseosolibacter sp.]|nr:RNA polymerase sigma-70 factor [Chryseosolibacter sp.]